MHEVSLRAASNRMDAYNLAVVLCPNLVKGSSPIRDVQLCAIPGAPNMGGATSTPDTPNEAALTEGKTTLGAIIKLCIQRYFEVFDEVWDRTEAVPVFRRTQGEAAEESGLSSSSSSASGVADTSNTFDHDDEEDLDDAMLVMPIGPGSHAEGNGGYKYRHRTTRSRGDSVARSMYTTGNGTISATPTVGKARSTISIEKGGRHMTGKKGSISIGRGTTRGKSSASGVEAMGVTAAGFFTPPSSAPPVPNIPRPRDDAANGRV